MAVRTPIPASRSRSPARCSSTISPSRPRSSPHAFTFDGTTVEVSLKASKEFTKDISASVKVCYACHGFEAGLAVVELRAADEFRVRVGRMTPAFGSFPQRHDPANHLTSDKPLPYDMGRMLHKDDFNEGVLPAPWVDNGIEIAGTYFFDGGQLDYAVYAVSGPKADAGAVDFDFVRSHDPTRYYIDNNSEPSVGARFAGTFELGDHQALTLGASAMGGHYDPDGRLAFGIAGADAVLQLDDIYLRGEYLIRRTQMDLGMDPATRFKFGPDANGHFDDWFTKDGFYGEGEVPVGPVTLIGRFDGLRRTGNALVGSPLSSYSTIYRYTFALSTKIASTIRLKNPRCQAMPRWRVPGAASNRPRCGAHCKSPRYFAANRLGSRHR